MPLTGRRIAITRPKAQFDSLAEAVRLQGGVPIAAPLLEITGIDNNQALQTAAIQLSQYCLAIFISPNAVSHSLPTLLENQPWPALLQVAAIGPGTAKALGEQGIHHCMLPPEAQFDSEGLLSRTELQASAISGQRVLLLRGEGGRELLADTLSARGATVEAIACYRRQAPLAIAEPFIEGWANKSLDGIVLSSSESLDNLMGALSTAQLQCLSLTPIFVPHTRIAERCRNAGLQQVVLTPPAEEGMLAGLLAYNWQTP
jgi:uroporphyrinogen-III synthase